MFEKHADTISRYVSARAHIHVCSDEIPRDRKQKR